MTERIMTRHPLGKSGVNIERGKYDAIRTAILDNLEKEGEMRYKDLSRAVAEQLAGKLDGKIPWYVVTVKLDLEARGEIERIPGQLPQKLRMRQQP
jgi:hypothetical protein